MQNDSLSGASCSIPPDRAECLGILAGSDNDTLSDHDILNALERPFLPDGRNSSLFEFIRPGETSCLVVSDHTRKTAMDRVLPLFLSALAERRGGGAKDLLEKMFILFACGIHRHPTRDEITRILGGKTAGDFEGRIFLHDPDDENNLLPVGTTSRGQLIRINRRAVEADRLILTGAAMYHYHAGFGGGRKSLVPGLADRAAIAHSHSLTLDPVRDSIRETVEPGVLDGNPVAEEMLEGALLNPPDFIINTVLGEDGRLAGVFAGDMVLAHRAACGKVEKISRINLRKPSDFVIASAGPASNWIQSHKALFNAHRAVHAHGRLILEAPCEEGLGDERFRYWITRKTVKDICDGLRQGPEVLGQTALSTRIRGARTVLVTRMNRRDAGALGIRTAPDLDSAIRLVLDDLRKAGAERPSYYLMPNASAVLPFCP